MQYDVFLSYNSADKADVVAIAQRLREAGVRAWLERRKSDTRRCLAARSSGWCKLLYMRGGLRGRNRSRFVAERQLCLFSTEHSLILLTGLYRFFFQARPPQLNRCSLALSVFLHGLISAAASMIRMCFRGLSLVYAANRQGLHLVGLVRNKTLQDWPIWIGAWKRLEYRMKICALQPSG